MARKVCCWCLRNLVKRRRANAGNSQGRLTISFIATPIWLHECRTRQCRTASQTGPVASLLQDGSQNIAAQKTGMSRQCQATTICPSAGSKPRQKPRGGSGRVTSSDREAGPRPSGARIIFFERMRGAKCRCYSTYRSSFGWACPRSRRTKCGISSKWRRPRAFCCPSFVWATSHSRPRTTDYVRRSWNCCLQTEGGSRCLLNYSIAATLSKS